MVVVVNDALGLCQFITQTLGIDEATNYLVAIESLSIDDWRKAAKVLPLPGTSDRRTKEAFIKALVTVFINSPPTDNQYLVGNLAVCPGFNPECIKLASYVISQTWAVNHLVRAAKQQAETATAGEVTACHTQPSVQPPTSEGVPPNLQVDTHRGANSNRYGNKPPWNKVVGSSKTGQNRDNRRQPDWTFGEDHSRRDNLAPQLVPVCLAIKSGSNETVDTLKKVVSKWTDLKEVKVEAVARTSISSTFRVQFKSPAAVKEKWTQSQIWPAGVAVRPWKGNPRVQLKPIDSRVYRKALYVGNLSPDATEATIQSNMEKIYQQEMASGSIVKIEAIVNEKSWENQQRLMRNNPAHALRRSMCVVLTSAPGEHLSELELKLEKFPLAMRRAVRPWRGPVPWTQGHRDAMAPDALPLTW